MAAALTRGADPGPRAAHETTGRYAREAGKGSGTVPARA
ncbi:hypothetical protein SSBG_06610 [Streptomyces sp. SPB074]|nr:hypothetical protein SSBG_06610 [Streptomyces sp. SPB074]